jgi:hypothetical protein
MSSSTRMYVRKRNTECKDKITLLIISGGLSAFAVYSLVTGINKACDYHAVGLGENN